MHVYIYIYIMYVHVTSHTDMHAIIIIENNDGTMHELYIQMGYRSIYI